MHITRLALIFGATSLSLLTFISQKCVNLHKYSSYTTFLDSANILLKLESSVQSVHKD